MKKRTWYEDQIPSMKRDVWEKISAMSKVSSDFLKNIQMKMSRNTGIRKTKSETHF
jgi:hypothetical protein